MLVNKVDIHSRPTQRRLLIRPGAIGDFIVSLPALEHLRVPYTEVWTTETNLPLVRFASAKNSIIASGLDRLGLLPADDVLARLRTFDSIVSWYGANRPEFRSLVAEQGLPFEFHTALPRLGECSHAVDFYCGQVGAPPGAIPLIEVAGVDRHNGVVLHPSASREDKRWPYARELTFPDLIKLRGPEEQLSGATFIPDLLELARFVAGARAYIGSDSGITHLAAAVGTPTIALFGPTDPAIWGPRGQRVCIIRGDTMADIRPERVVAALAGFGIY
jgi:heptosyltransferase-3